MAALPTTKKRLAFLIAAIIVLIIGYFIPAPEGLSDGGKMTIVILVFTFVMWIGDVMPKSITSIAAIIMLPFFGAAESLTEVYGNFVNSIFFFLLAVFGIAAVFSKTDLPARIMVAFVKTFGNNTKMLVFAFGATSFIVSAFMSDLAACALVAGIILKLDKELDLPSSFVKCTMIMVPLGSMTGGIMMPISSAANATIMQLLASSSGQVVPFAQWMLVGIPMGVIFYIVAWGLCMLIFRPENLDDATMAMLKETFKDMPPMNTLGKKAVGLLCFLMVLWIAGSWITVLDSTFVALLGWVVMFIPGIDLLTWDEYQKETPFDLIFMLGAMFSLVAAMTSCGTISWLVNLITGSATDWSTMMFFAVIMTAIVIFRAFIPNGAPVVVMATPAVLAVGTTLGADPVWLLLGLSTACNITCLMPIIDSQWLMTYRSGKFSILDCLKLGIPLSIVVIILSCLLIPPLASFSYILA